MADSKDRFVEYCPPRRPVAETMERARAFYGEMDARRSVRYFSSDPVPKEAVTLAIQTASTAPSGAHRQPWTFVLVGDGEIKRQIREAAEAEEKRNYEGGRMPPDWLEALAPLGTSWEKPYLEHAPWLVVVFEQTTGPQDESGRPQKHYYVKESVGIACGMFIAAIHHMGLATLTHTPSPMGFLGRILGRPRNEKPYILFPVGYPASNSMVPELRRKPLSEIMVEDPQPAPGDQESA